MGPNPHWHSQPRKTTIVVLVEENPNVKAKARILLLPASTPLLSGKTKIRIKIRKI